MGNFPQIFKPNLICEVCGFTGLCIEIPILDRHNESDGDHVVCILCLHQKIEKLLEPPKPEHEDDGEDEELEAIQSIEEVNYDMGGYIVTTNKQQIKILIDNQANCCEVWGYFTSEDNPDEFIGAELREINLTDTARNVEKVRVRTEIPYVEYGNTMFVDLVTNRGVLQFVVYNCHNGYYGHNAKIESNQLTHSTTL